MAYVSPNIQRFYLSRETLIQHCMISRDFPRISSADENCTVTEVDDEINTNHYIGELSATKFGPCGCPTLSLPLLCSKDLPFACTKENIPKM